MLSPKTVKIPSYANLFLTLSPHLNLNIMRKAPFCNKIFYSKCPVIQIIFNAKINMAMNGRKIKILHNTPNIQDKNHVNDLPWLASSLKLATSQYGNHCRKLCIHPKIPRYLIKYKNLFLITTSSTSTSTCCHALASP